MKKQLLSVVIILSSINFTYAMDRKAVEAKVSVPSAVQASSEELLSYDDILKLIRAESNDIAQMYQEQKENRYFMTALAFCAGCFGIQMFRKHSHRLPTFIAKKAPGAALQMAIQGVPKVAAKIVNPGALNNFIAYVIKETDMVQNADLNFMSSLCMQQDEEFEVTAKAPELVRQLIMNSFKIAAYVNYYDSVTVETIVQKKSARKDCIANFVKYIKNLKDLQPVASEALNLELLNGLG